MAKRRARTSKHPPKHPRTHPPRVASEAQPHADRPFAPGYGLVGPDEGLGLLPWTWVERKLNRCRTFFLATIYHGKVRAESTDLAGDATGAHSTHPRPHVMPLWGVWVDDAFYFSTGRKSRKGQNLAANPACTITNDDGEEAVIIEGQATPLSDKNVLERVVAIYQKKYKFDMSGMDEPMFKLKPTKVFAFIEKSFPKSATRWKL